VDKISSLSIFVVAFAGIFVGLAGLSFGMDIYPNPIVGMMAAITFQGCYYVASLFLLKKAYNYNNGK